MSPGTERRGLTIAMDGPAGAGKSTLAKIIANRLGYLYIDTGAMYRALSLKVLRTGVDPEDDDGLDRLAREAQLQLQRSAGGGNHVFLDEEDVSVEIRDPAVTQIVARVSSSPGLRIHMVESQRRLAEGGGVVMDGRDIGSRVLPDADVKLYVTASLAERAQRRQQQLAKAGHQIPLSEIEAEIAQRDEADRNKGESSLVQTVDAILVDTTGRSVDDVIAEILSYCRRG